jgi:hypothetical protein
VADRLALTQLAAAEGQGSLRAANGTRPATVGAGWLRLQGVRLLAQQGSKDALGQAGRGGVGDVFHGLEIDVLARAGVAEGPAGDDFAPLSGEVPDFLELLGGELTTRHGKSFLVLVTINGHGFFFPLYGMPLRGTKLVMASARDK